MKYSADGPFNEPVVICDSCAKVNLTEEMKKMGCCSNCGNRRVRNVQVLSGDNLKLVKQWISDGICDPEWLQEFEEK